MVPWIIRLFAPEYIFSIPGLFCLGCWQAEAIPALKPAYIIIIREEF